MNALKTSLKFDYDKIAAYTETDIDRIMNLERVTGSYP